MVSAIAGEKTIKENVIKYISNINNNIYPWFRVSFLKEIVERELGMGHLTLLDLSELYKIRFSR